MNHPVIEQFSQFALRAELLAALNEVGYEKPTPIQAACIPALLDGRDVLGEAQTGTGKTAAFALPVLHRLDLAQRRPQALVLAPTRELALQVAEAFQSYAKDLPGFQVVPIYGGQSMSVQLRQLKRGAHVIVGTPGRIMDHIERKSLDLSQLASVVLDEADEMLRMGFIDDVQWILEQTPASRQTVLFSATMPAAVRRVAHQHQREPYEVQIKASTATIPTIRQRYCQINSGWKLDALTRIFETEENLDAAIIFVRTKIATTDLADKLEARGYSAAALNGDMTQQLRERVIEQIKNGSIDLIVATDVAARGLDVGRLSHVINYDIPYDVEAYVHRIGRTGRAGRTGEAILFVTPREQRMLRIIERATKQKISPLQLPSQQAVFDRRVAQFCQRVQETLASEDLDFFLNVVTNLEHNTDADLYELAAALVFLAQRERPLQNPGENGHQHNRPEAHLPPRHDGGHRQAQRQSAPQHEFAADTALVRYRIEVGHNQRIRPKDIVGAIANESGIASRFIGQINLYDDFSTVELPRELPEQARAILANQTSIRQHPLKLREIGADEFIPPPRRAPGGKNERGRRTRKKQ